LTSDTERRELGRHLDLHHDPSLTGEVEVCAVCGVSTDTGYATGRGHLPQPEEVSRAKHYLATFSGRNLPPEPA
jgi:hypothetical protein